MAAGAARLCVTFLFVSAFKFVCAVILNIPAVSGQTAILSCRTQNESIIVVEWNRLDLKNKHVLFYWDGLSDTDNQHSSFKKRVDLQDRQMKDGDVSVILKDVTINDAGAYECRVFTRGTNYKKRATLETKPICIINLAVVPPGGDTEDGSFGLLFGLLLSAVLLLGLVFFIYRRWKQQQSQDSHRDAQRQQLQTSQ